MGRAQCKDATFTSCVLRGLWAFAAWKYLDRLQTDHVDLLQFHEIIRMDDPDRIFGHGGALEAVIDLRLFLSVNRPLGGIAAPDFTDSQFTASDVADLLPFVAIVLPICCHFSSCSSTM